MSTRAAWKRLPAAAALAAFVATLACRGGALSPSGAIAATLTGAGVCVPGWRWGASLVAFFLSSSALSAVGQQRKAPLLALWAKGSRRDAGQVFANGAIPTLAALWHAVRPGPLPHAAFAGALAASTADTWATELGVLSATPPRLLTTGRVVPRGTSGAVTSAGLAAALAGSAFLAMCAAALYARPARGQAARRRGWLRGRLLAGVTVAGLAGALADSLLGATVQAAYRCPSCQAPTEQRIHRCGTPGRLERGLPWLDNDGVNLLASATGAATAMLWQAAGE